jgi:Zinc finger, C3HC4 type (RING finger)
MNIRLWKLGDKPWIEHKEYAPDCHYVKLNSRIKKPKSMPKFKPHEMFICKICLVKPIHVVFIPCGHFAACTKCAPGVIECPLCRAKIKSNLKAFI